MKRASAGCVVLAILLLLIVAGSSVDSAFGLGEQPPSIYIVFDPYTQKVNAGDTAVYNARVMAGWVNDWFNVTIGSGYAGSAENPSVKPLPEGVEGNYSRRVFIGETFVTFPISVKVSPSTGSSTIDLVILVSGLSKTGEKYYNQMFYGSNTVRLYVEPRETPLGTASTVFYEGFDREYQEFKEKDVGGPNGWTLSKTGTVNIADNLGSGYFRISSLRMSKTSSAEPVWIEHSFPKINGSFILDFALLPNGNGENYQMDFTMNLIDSTHNKSITAGISHGGIWVQQPRPYGVDFSIIHWYKFRIEANATDHIFRWYLDNRYMDTLPFTGQPDKIRIAITSQDQRDVGYVDDIFLQKITEPPTTTSTTTGFASPKTITIEQAVTITTTQTSILTSITTLPATSTSTITTRLGEQVTDSSTYAWAVSATVATIVLAAILLLQRRRTK